MNDRIKYEVWSIREAEGNQRPYQKHVGQAVALTSRPGVIAVTLDALPLGARMELRPVKEEGR